jgi:hypothetical protein
MTPHRSLAAALLALLATAAAAGPAPEHEVFVADLDLAAGKVAAPRNVSDNPGYDNQPAFLPDGSALLYVRGGQGGNSEVWRYDLASGESRALTATAEAEYSPTPLADGGAFSAVRVEQPGASGEAFTDSQRLATYGYDGQPRGAVHPDWRRVGYHAWLDAGHVAMFIVGGGPDRLPDSLVVGDVASGAQTLLARGIGRSLGRSPEGRVTFVDKSIDAAWSVATIMPGENRPTVLAGIPRASDEDPDARSEFFCWLPDGTLLMGQGRRLLRFDPRHPGAGFAPFAEVDVPGAITRLAVSRDGKRLAMAVLVRHPVTRGIRG